MNYSIQRVILNDFSTEGLLDDMKKCNEFKKLYTSEIKTIMYKKYRKDHKGENESAAKINFNIYFNQHIYPGVLKYFKKELKENPNIDIKKYVSDLKKDIREEDKEINNEIKNNYYNKNKSLFIKLSQKLVESNKEAINKCKNEFEDLLNEYKKNNYINSNISSDKAINLLITCKSAPNYLRNIESVAWKYNNSETDHFFGVSISDSKNLKDNFSNYNNSELGKYFKEFKYVRALSKIIYKSWYDIAVKYIKDILGNKIVEIENCENRYIAVVVR